jgi:acyl dehydratase
VAEPARAGREPGDQLQSISLAITITRAIQAAAATGDWFPGHHDAEYARAQGLPAIYVNALFVQGLVDRLVTDHYGAGARIRRRKLRTLSPLFAGRTATVRGSVVGVRQDLEEVDVEVTLDSEDGRCVVASVTVCLMSTP